MTKIKFCGLLRACDIEAVNEIKPEYIGFVFAPKSKRFIKPEKAAELKKMLSPDIQAVGVFVNERLEVIAKLLNKDVVDMVQLHGSESEEYIRLLRKLTDKPIIKAFCIKTQSDTAAFENSSADYVLFDSGAGTGSVFDWEIINSIKRPYFLAGGLLPENVENAVIKLRPFSVDVSSGIETDGVKDKTKMTVFAAAIRKED